MMLRGNGTIVIMIVAANSHFILNTIGIFPWLLCNYRGPSIVDGGPSIVDQKHMFISVSLDRTIVKV